MNTTTPLFKFTPEKDTLPLITYDENTPLLVHHFEPYDEKKMLDREKNNKSARESRLKKKLLFEKYAIENKALNLEVAILKRENENLKKRVGKYERQRWENEQLKRKLRKYAHEHEEQKLSSLKK